MTFLGDRLENAGVHSLDALAVISEDKLQKVAAVDRSVRDYGRLRKRLVDLWSSTDTYNQIKARQWKKFLETVNHNKWSIGGSDLIVRV